MFYLISFTLFKNKRDRDTICLIRTQTYKQANKTNQADMFYLAKMSKREKGERDRERGGGGREGERWFHNLILMIGYYNFSYWFVGRSKLLLLW